MNDLRGLLLLMLIGLPLTATVNLECRTHFKCLDATHFHICVDFGDGNLRAIETVVFPCPTGMVCDETKKNECHVPIFMATTQISTLATVNEKTSTYSPKTTTSAMMTTDQNISLENMMANSSERTLTTVSTDKFTQTSVLTPTYQYNSTKLHDLVFRTDTSTTAEIYRENNVNKTDIPNARTDATQRFKTARQTYSTKFYDHVNTTDTSLTEESYYVNITTTAVPNVITKVSDSVNTTDISTTKESDPINEIDKTAFLNATNSILFQKSDLSILDVFDFMKLPDSIYATDTTTTEEEGKYMDRNDTIAFTNVTTVKTSFTPVYLINFTKSYDHVKTRDISTMTEKKENESKTTDILNIKSRTPTYVSKNSDVSKNKTYTSATVENKKLNKSHTIANINVTPDITTTKNLDTTVFKPTYVFTPTTQDRNPTDTSSTIKKKVTDKSDTPTETTIFTTTYIFDSSKTDKPVNKMNKSTTAASKQTDKSIAVSNIIAAREFMSVHLYNSTNQDRNSANTTDRKKNINNKPINKSDDDVSYVTTDNSTESTIFTPIYVFKSTQQDRNLTNQIDTKENLKNMRIQKSDPIDVPYVTTDTLTEPTVFTTTYLFDSLKTDDPVNKMNISTTEESKQIDKSETIAVSNINTAREFMPVHIFYSTKRNRNPANVTDTRKTIQNNRIDKGNQIDVPYKTTDIPTETTVFTTTYLFDSIKIDGPVNQMNISTTTESQQLDKSNTIENKNALHILKPTVDTLTTTEMKVKQEGKDIFFKSTEKNVFPVASLSSTTDLHHAGLTVELMTEATLRKSNNNLEQFSSMNLYKPDSKLDVKKNEESLHIDLLITTAVTMATTGTSTENYNNAMLYNPGSPMVESVTKEAIHIDNKNNIGVMTEVTTEKSTETIVIPNKYLVDSVKTHATAKTTDTITIHNLLEKNVYRATHFTELYDSVNTEYDSTTKEYKEIHKSNIPAFPKLSINITSKRNSKKLFNFSHMANVTEKSIKTNKTELPFKSTGVSSYTKSTTFLDSANMIDAHTTDESISIINSNLTAFLKTTTSIPAAIFKSSRENRMDVNEGKVVVDIPNTKSDELSPKIVNINEENKPNAILHVTTEQNKKNEKLLTSPSTDELVQMTAYTNFLLDNNISTGRNTLRDNKDLDSLKTKNISQEKVLHMDNNNTEQNRPRVMIIVKNEIRNNDIIQDISDTKNYIPDASTPGDDSTKNTATTMNNLLERTKSRKAISLISNNSSTQVNSSEFVKFEPQLKNNLSISRNTSYENNYLILNSTTTTISSSKMDIDFTIQNKNNVGNSLDLTSQQGSTDGIIPITESLLLPYIRTSTQTTSGLAENNISERTDSSTKNSIIQTSTTSRAENKIVIKGADQAKTKSNTTIYMNNFVEKTHKERTFDYTQPNEYANVSIPPTESTNMSDLIRDIPKLTTILLNTNKKSRVNQTLKFVPLGLKNSVIRYESKQNITEAAFNTSNVQSNVEDVHVINTTNVQANKYEPLTNLFNKTSKIDRNISNSLEIMSTTAPQLLKSITEFECVTEGRFSDIIEVNYYYICVKNNESFVRIKFSCQNGYHVNKSTVMCEVNKAVTKQFTVLSTLVSHTTQYQEDYSKKIVTDKHGITAIESVDNIPANYMTTKTTEIIGITEKTVTTKHPKEWATMNKGSTVVTNKESEEDTGEADRQLNTSILVNTKVQKIEPLSVQRPKQQEMSNVEVFTNNLNTEMKHDMPIVVNIGTMPPNTISTTLDVMVTKSTGSLQEEKVEYFKLYSTIPTRRLPISNLSTLNNYATRTTEPVKPSVSHNSTSVQNKVNTMMLEPNRSRVQNGTNFVCPNKTNAKYAENNDCRKFYICAGNDQPVVSECSIGTVFSDLRKQCTKNLSHCIRNNEFMCPSEGRFHDIFIDIYYYICVKKMNHYIRLKLRCQKGYHVNELTLKCELNEENSEQSSVSHNSGESSEKSTVEKKTEHKRSTESHRRKKKKDKSFTCVEVGYFPDPVDCRKYYVCSLKRDRIRKKRKQCKSGKVFHKDKRRCVSAES